MPHENSVRA